LIPSDDTSIYLDANILIYATEAGNPWTDQLRTLLKSVYRGQCRAITSELTLTEVLAKPYATGSARLVRIYETLLSARSAILTVPVDRDILRRAAHLRSAPRLKLADAIHLATALQGGCSHFLSNDGYLLGAMPPDIAALPIDRLADLRAG
jgi:predicted nucleic acid-binding protein